MSHSPPPALPLGVVPEAGAPWPQHVPECQIAGNGFASAEFPVFSTPDAVQPIAHFAAASPRNPAIWDKLPLLGARRIAAVNLTENFELRGWAPLPDASFQLTSHVEIVPGSVWIPSGTIASVLGTNDAEVVVRVPAPFAQPSTLDATVPCGHLVFSTETVLQTEPGSEGAPFRFSKDRVTLYRTPGSDPLLVVQPSTSSCPHGLLRQTRRGFAHVLVGGSSALSCGPLAAFDAWVDADAVERTSAQCREECGDYVDRRSRCDPPEATVVRDTPVRLEPESSSPEMARARRGLEVVVRDRQDSFAAVEPVAPTIRAPKGRRFWVEWTVLEFDEGCPKPPEPGGQSTSGSSTEGL